MTSGGEGGLKIWTREDKGEGGKNLQTSFMDGPYYKQRAFTKPRVSDRVRGGGVVCTTHFNILEMKSEIAREVRDILKCFLLVVAHKNVTARYAHFSKLCDQNL